MKEKESQTRDWRDKGERGVRHTEEGKAELWNTFPDFNPHSESSSEWHWRC